MRTIAVFRADTGDALGVVNLSSHAYERALNTNAPHFYIVEQGLINNMIGKEMVQDEVCLVGEIIHMRLRRDLFYVFTGVRQGINTHEIAQLLEDIQYTLEARK